MNDEEILLSKRLSELANLAYQRGIPMFSDFLTLNEQNILNQVITKMPPICVKTMGGYNLAERKLCAFYPDEYFEQENPIICIEIRLTNKRFAEELGHRDYLGALVNLGITRAVMGDIVVAKDCAYVFCLEKISSFILSELCSVKHTPVTARICEFNEEISIQTEEITGSVSSVRIDSILSLVTGMSRSKAITYIEDAKVFVNGKLITTNSYNLKEQDIISVRGVGKFKYTGVTGTSKKGRTFVSVLKFS